MATLVKPYTTVESLKNEMRLRIEDTTHDAWLQECINTASRMIERMTGRSFWFHDHSEVGSELEVPESGLVDEMIYLTMPIITLTAVLVGDEALDDDDYKIRTAGLSALGGAIQIEGITSTWFASTSLELGVELRGTFGYALAVENPTITPPPLIPGEINRAATLIASALSGMNQREQISYTGERQSVADTRIPKEVPDMLKPFKVPVL